MSSEGWAFAGICEEMPARRPAKTLAEIDQRNVELERRWKRGLTRLGKLLVEGGSKAARESAVEAVITEFGYTNVSLFQRIVEVEWLAAQIESVLAESVPIAWAASWALSRRLSESESRPAGLALWARHFGEGE